MLSQREEVNVCLIDLAAYQIPHMESVLAKHPDPPEDLVKIGDQLQGADAMIFVSPEYNGGYSSALKNVVDFFPKSTYADKPIGVAAVSAGGLGGMRAALQMQQLVLALWGFPTPQMLLVSNVRDRFDEAGRLFDEDLGKKMDAFLDKLIWFSEAIVEKKQKIDVDTVQI
jgi:NAD(P)H-dependent FMN reductase